MNRKAALGACRVAGYHDDTRSFVRAYVENRISYTSAKTEWNRGAQMKKAGVVCDCFFCKRAAHQTKPTTMSMDYIRKTYDVPAKRGGRIKYTNGGTFYGTIASAKGGYLRVRWDEDGQRLVSLHPTWCVEYVGAQV